MFFQLPLNKTPCFSFTWIYHYFIIGSSDLELFYSLVSKKSQIQNFESLVFRTLFQPYQKKIEKKSNETFIFNKEKRNHIVPEHLLVLRFTVAYETLYYMK